MGKHGFDLTDIDSANWQEILSKLNAEFKGKITEEESSYWLWEGKDIKIVTSNNPITGEHNLESIREPRVGYAGYIGIEGSDTLVSEFVEYMREFAKIKGESPKRRDFI